MLPSFDAGLYQRVRQAEGRVYPDELVRQLPSVPGDHPYSMEWRARAATFHRLHAYLRRAAPARRPLAVLELGCGSGWLIAGLARALGCLPACGLDPCQEDIAQAGRVFSGLAGLSFAVGDGRALPLAPARFDIVLLASVIQYVSDLPRCLRELRGLLRAGGEIHILDSPLYAPAETAAARARTQAYYARLGFPEAAGHYYHHTWLELRAFHPAVRHAPAAPLSRLRRRLGLAEPVFPWLVIRP